MDALVPFKPRRAKVSLTALIDVVFILLMFFMLTSSFTPERQLDLAAPVASTDARADEPQRLLVAVNGDASLYGNEDDALSDSRLSELLDEARPVVLLPHPDAQVQTLVSALTRLKNLQMAQISLGKPYPAAAVNGEGNRAP